MPGTDGFDFAKSVKQGGRWSETPIVALSSRTTTSDFERGREAGFSDYVSKSDRGALLEVLAQTVTLNRGAA